MNKTETCFKSQKLHAHSVSRQVTERICRQWPDVPHITGVCQAPETRPSYLGLDKADRIQLTL